MKNLKKIIAGLATVSVLGIGGVLIAGGSEEEPQTKDVATADVKTEVVEEPTEVVEKEVVELPTARTTDIGNQYPWEKYFVRFVKEKQDAGEVVYLWSDAAAFESYLLEMIAFQPDDNAPLNKEEVMTAPVKRINEFARELAEHKPEYFSILEEVKTAIQNEDYELAKTKVNEAKTLRESK